MAPDQSFASMKAASSDFERKGKVPSPIASTASHFSREVGSSSLFGALVLLPLLVKIVCLKGML